MATVLIQNLTAATTPLTGAELIPLVQGGITKQTAMTNALAQPYYAKTTAENTAGVTPTYYTYEPGDVRRYGADPTGVADSTTAFANAILSNARVWVPDGSYLIGSSLSLRTGMHFDMSSGATLKASVRSWASGGLVRCVGISNVTISGGNIDGQKALNSTGQLFGIDLRGATSVKISNIRIINCPGSTSAGVNGGDGIYVGYSGTSATYSQNVTITGCIIDGCVRQGVSVTCASGVTITGNQILNTSGTAPGGGIDIEADSVSDTLKDISITGNIISGNYYGVIVTTAAKNVSVSGNTFSANRLDDVALAGCEHVTVEGNAIYMSGVKTSPAYGVNINASSYLSITGNIIRGNMSDANERAGVFVQSANYTIIANNVINNMRSSAIVCGFSAQTVNFTDVLISGNICKDNVDPAVTTTAVITISGNSGSGLYPARVSLLNNVLTDTRTGGSESDYGVQISTSIPAATISGYRMAGNRIFGSTDSMPGGTSPPLAIGFTWNPGSLVDGTGETSSNVTVTGAAIGDTVDVYPPYALQGILCTAWVSAADTVLVRLQNATVSTIDLANGGWRVRVRKFFE